MITPLTISLVRSGIAPSFSPWECVLEIPLDATLAELHLAIQQATDFENDHLYMFVIAKDSYARHQVQFDCDEEVYSTTVAELLAQAKGFKIYYLFDFGDDWVFRIAASRKKPQPPEAGVTYPRLLSESGKKPVQYPDWDEYEEDEAP